MADAGRLLLVAGGRPVKRCVGIPIARRRLESLVTCEVAGTG